MIAMQGLQLAPLQQGRLDPALRRRAGNVTLLLLRLLDLARPHQPARAKPLARFWQPKRDLSSTPVLWAGVTRFIAAPPRCQVRHGPPSRSTALKRGKRVGTLRRAMAGSTAIRSSLWRCQRDGSTTAIGASTGPEGTQTHAAYVAFFVQLRVVQKSASLRS